MLLQLWVTQDRQHTGDSRRKWHRYPWGLFTWKHRQISQSCIAVGGHCSSAFYSSRPHFISEVVAHFTSQKRHTWSLSPALFVRVWICLLGCEFAHFAHARIRIYGCVSVPSVLPVCRTSRPDIGDHEGAGLVPVFMDTTCEKNRGEIKASKSQSKSKSPRHKHLHRITVTILLCVHFNTISMLPNLNCRGAQSNL